MAVDRTYETAVDLSESQFCVVVMDSNGKATLPSAAGAGSILGVLQNRPGYKQDRKIGRAARIRKSGLTKVKAASAFAIGDPLEIADTQGRVRKATQPSSTWTGTRVNIVGQAEQAASGPDEMVVMNVNISYYSV
jgi:hypothetical protein